MTTPVASAQLAVATCAPRLVAHVARDAALAAACSPPVLALATGASSGRILVVAADSAAAGVDLRSDASNATLAEFLGAAPGSLTIVDATYARARCGVLYVLVLRGGQYSVVTLVPGQNWAVQFLFPENVESCAQLSWTSARLFRRWSQRTPVSG
jgi:hypothetical protein